MNDITSKTYQSKVDLRVPDGTDLLAAMGRVTAAHSNLELVLKMCVKSLENKAVLTTMTELGRTRTSDVRSKIQTLVDAATGDTQIRERVSELLRKAKDLAEKRNELLHRPWGYTDNEELLSKNEDWIWDEAPNAESLNEVAKEIDELVEELNNERLNGVIKRAVGNRTEAGAGAGK